MKVIKYILPLLCLGVIITACNSDDEESIAATEVQNLTTQSAPGSITLTWEYAVEEDANTTRLVEIRYYDPAVKKNVKKTISRFSNSFTIDNALKRYGEYEFEVQPFSTTFTPGVIQRITGVAERAPVIDEKTSTELAITIDNLTLGGFKPDGVTTIPQSSCIGDGNGPERLLDNNASTFLNTAYSGVPAGTTEFLKNLPHLPGVYRYFDKDGNLLYVGKARDLKRRVSSYFQKTLAPRTKLMVDQIASAQITVVNSEAEALILESNLIKTQDPRFNILFRDDKSYPYLKLSSGEYPRLSYYRGALDKRNSYFGPYPNANAAKDTMLLLQKVFQLRTCETSVFNNRSRPCLLYQIGRCSGGCCKKVSPEEYGKSVDLAKEFLRGYSQKVQEDLTRRMNEYSQKLDFERAAVMRDHLAAISNVIHQQSMEAAPDANADIIAAVAAQGEVCVNLAMVRGGRHLGDKASFPSLGRNAELPELEEVLEAFITHHYTQMDVPPVVIINLEERSPRIEELLNTIAGKKVSVIYRPQNIRRKWLELAVTNAKVSLGRKVAEEGSQKKRIGALVQELGLDIPESEYEDFRVECFDISHSSGEATQASCVVFAGNRMDSSQYRRFNIKDVTAGDDYAAMKQVLTRRYQRVANGEATLPNIVLVDGGRGQVKMACEVFDELGLDKNVIVGVAKGEGRKVGLEELVFPDPNKEPLKLGQESPALMLIAQIRDEAHRFAITGMRAKRAKARNYSRIEDLEGVGSKRRQKLLERFGSLKVLSNASVEDIASVDGISQTLARQIYAQLHGQIS